MTRRDRPDSGRGPSDAPDAPDLPASWCRHADESDEIVFVREGGDVRVSATHEGNAWRISGTQRTGEAKHTTVIGGATTRDQAVRSLVAAMERINAALAASEWNGRIPLCDVVDGVCERDADTMDYLVQ